MQTLRDADRQDYVSGSMNLHFQRQRQSALREKCGFGSATIDYALPISIPTMQRSLLCISIQSTVYSHGLVKDGNVTVLTAS